MNKITSINKCTGCSACKNICPKNAISMSENKEGFKYPHIDKNKCINCGLCKKVCPIKKNKNNNTLNICYAGYDTNLTNTLNKASSGNIFELIAEYILNNNGIVIGAAFDKDNHLQHIAITNKQELVKLKGSKYLQSDLKSIFSYIKQNIKEKKILFTGTPCQVAGLKHFLQKEYNNLYCIDLICHGVPSPKLFKKYITELENKEKQAIIDYNFRDKTTGWETFSNTIKFERKSITENHNINKYMKFFLTDIALRKSCYSCNFKLKNKYSDITLGDFWGIKKFHPDMYNNNQGVSAIIINSEKGIELFENIKKRMHYKQSNIIEISKYNSALEKSVKYNKHRKNFFKNLDKMNIENLYNKYINKTSIKQLLIKLYNKQKIIKRR